MCLDFVVFGCVFSETNVSGWCLYVGYVVVVGAVG
jgi:hypothetical protein